MVKCVICGTVMTMGMAKYCSAKCKQVAYRNRRNAPAVTDVTVTKPESVTVDSPNIAKIRGTGEGVPNFGQPDCECRHCQNHRANKGSQLTLNHGPYKPADELAEHEVNRVSLPGDADYVACGKPVDNSPQLGHLTSGVVGMDPSLRHDQLSPRTRQ